MGVFRGTPWGGREGLTWLAVRGKAQPARAPGLCMRTRPGLGFAARMLWRTLDGFVQLRALPVPIVCAVHGKLIGGGVAACLNSDYIVADSAATFEHGNLVRGVCPLGGLSQRLVDVAGRGRTLGLYLSNATLDAVLGRMSEVHDRENGNGRAVRNLLERAKRAQALRLMAEDKVGECRRLKRQVAELTDRLDGAQRQIAELRNKLRETEARHVRQLAACGVTALKHGRKGKPHPRHVRVGPTLRRLEWSKPGSSGGESPTAERLSERPPPAW